MFGEEESPASGSPLWALEGAPADRLGSGLATTVLSSGAQLAPHRTVPLGPASWCSARQQSPIHAALGGGPFLPLRLAGCEAPLSQASECLGGKSGTGGLGLPHINQCAATRGLTQRAQPSGPGGEAGLGWGPGIPCLAKGPFVLARLHSRKGSKKFPSDCRAEFVGHSVGKGGGSPPLAAV